MAHQMKMGLYMTRAKALESAASYRKFNINWFNNTTFRVQRTKNPRNPKKPGYYVIKTSKKRVK
jgi:hypothetical protein